MIKRKHGIRPPRRPRGEAPSVTIEIQDQQIRLLIDRCTELEKQRAEIEGFLRENSDTAIQLMAMEAAHTRLQGWQDCAREMLGLALNSIAPGS